MRWSDVKDRYTDNYTEMYGVLTWVSAAQEPDRRGRGRDVFFNHRVADRVVIDTLREAEDFLKKTAPMFT